MRAPEYNQAIVTERWVLLRTISCETTPEDLRWPSDSHWGSANLLCVQNVCVCSPVEDEEPAWIEIKKGGEVGRNLDRVRGRCELYSWGSIWAETSMREEGGSQYLEETENRGKFVQWQSWIFFFFFNVGTGSWTQKVDNVSRIHHDKPTVECFQVNLL